MGIRIFEEKIRTDGRPAYYTEKSYNFYDRCSWQAAANVRELLNSWLSDFPEDGQIALAKRFRTEFEAAFFELLCYTIFRRLGFSLEEHPFMSHTSKRCDFGVSNAKHFFYLECINTDGYSEDDRGRRNTENLFYDLLDAMDCPNFYLQLQHVSFSGKRTPAFSKVRQELQALIDQIDPDDSNVEEVKDFSDLPAFRHKDPLFQLQLNLIPKPAQRRTEGSRNIGVFSTKTHVGGFGHVLYEAIKRKAARYGKVEAPFLIAVNALTELPVDEYDIEDALYDHFTAYLPAMLSGRKEIPKQTESAFLTHGRFTHTRVSAVLFTRATPTNLFHVPYWIYLNPKASHHLPLDGLPLKNHRITIDGIEVTSGRSIGELLALPEDWPGEKNK